jgi:hypothetical protein
MNKHLIWLPAVALAVTLGGQAAFYATELPTTSLHASWQFKPKSIGEARAKADSVVEAEVVSVQRGADIVTKAPGEPGDEDRIPTQQVTLKVLKTHKGSQKVGDTIQVFQTGGLQVPTTLASEPSKDQVRIQAKKVILEGDPLYQVGEQHLLMLDQGPKGQLKTVAPQGRFKIERNGTVTPAVDDEVTAPLKGKGLAELQRQVGEQGLRGGLDG